MGERQPAFERFVAVVQAPPEALPLDEAALCIAAHAQPDLDVDAYLTRLDDLAGEIRTPTLDGLVRHCTPAAASPVTPTTTTTLATRS